MKGNAGLIDWVYCTAITVATVYYQISSNLNIRFSIDVPYKTKERRKLEKVLIETWLPPFNKETRGYWSTPFTSQIK